MNCTAAAFTDKDEAKLARRTAQRYWRGFRATIYPCEVCDCFHFRGTMSQFSLRPKATEILKLIAQGFTKNEIAAIVGMNNRTVETYYDTLRQSFEALSLPHLIAIAIWLGVLDPKEFIPPLTERNHPDATDRTDRLRNAVQRGRETRVPARDPKGNRRAAAGNV